MIKKTILLLLLPITLVGCVDKNTGTTDISDQTEEALHPFDWRAATVYFLLTDRFNNGDPSNDVNFNRTKETAVLRGFKGGDIKGVTQKIEEGYFTDLGVNAIWMTPIVEQIHDGTDEGTGFTYGYHGYWTKDWTALDPNFGTREDLAELVATAHENGIRILLDAVINHTGPVTEQDTQWPDSWVRTAPKCTFENYETTVTCTLVENLPDIKTESDEAVELPPQLVEKWKTEGRFGQEMAELDAFFEHTGYPRAPRFYIMKWLADYIIDFGIDGYRVDTVKHTEASVWEEFKIVCEDAFSDWKEANPEKVMDDNDFYLVGEIYFYDVNNGKYYDFGDRKENYFENSFDAMINFNLRSKDDRSLEEIYRAYSNILNGELKGFGTLNYVTSHDDGDPFDKSRTRTYESATRLLLAPGAAQIYYGDETARSLEIEGTNGDATLRSFMNWEDLGSKQETREIHAHWQKLGRFRRDHPAVGAGLHKMISAEPYIFQRTFSEGKINDLVVIGLGLPKGKKTISVLSAFEDKMLLRDAYSGQTAKVADGLITINTEFEIVLLEKVE